jgi:hypothetical protein
MRNQEIHMQVFKVLIRCIQVNKTENSQQPVLKFYYTKFKKKICLAVLKLFYVYGWT